MEIQKRPVSKCVAPFRITESNPTVRDIKITLLRGHSVFVEPIARYHTSDLIQPGDEGVALPHEAALVGQARQGFSHEFGALVRRP